MGERAAAEMYQLVANAGTVCSPRTERRNQIGKQLCARLAALRASPQKMLNGASTAAFWHQLVQQMTSTPPVNALLLERAFVQACPKLTAAAPTTTAHQQQRPHPQALATPAVRIAVQLSAGTTQQLDFASGSTPQQMINQIARHFGLPTHNLSVIVVICAPGGKQSPPLCYFATAADLRRAIARGPTTLLVSMDVTSTSSWLTSKPSSAAIASTSSAPTSATTSYRGVLLRKLFPGMRRMSAVSLRWYCWNAHLLFVTPLRCCCVPSIA
jgi:hypothetical protein